MKPLLLTLLKFAALALLAYVLMMLAVPGPDSQTIYYLEQLANGK